MISKVRSKLLEGECEDRRMVYFADMKDPIKLQKKGEIIKWH